MGVKRGKRTTLPRNARVRKTMVAISAVATASCLVAACGSSKPSAVVSTSTTSKPTASKALRPISLAFFTGGFSGVEVDFMKSEGIFKKFDLTVKTVSATSGPAVVAAELSRTVDIGIGYVPLVLPALLKGHALKYVSPIGRPNFYNLIAQPSISTKPAGIGLTANAIANIRHMKGATVAVSAIGGAADLFMSALADAAGIKPTSYTPIAGGGPSTLVDAFKSHKVQYLVTDHPVFTFLHATHTPYHIVAMVNTSLKNDWHNLFVDGWVASPAFIKSHPVRTLDFCKSMIYAANAMGKPANKAAVLKAAEEDEGITPAEGNEWYKSNLYLYSPGYVITKKLWEQQGPWLAGTPYKGAKLPTFSSIEYKPCFNLVEK